MEERFSDDIIADAVREYVKIQMKLDRCIDVDYIVHFYQKYSWENEWHECTEIIHNDSLPNGVITFGSDFCEGQTDVKDISILSLHEVGDIMDDGYKYMIKLKEGVINGE